MLSQVFILSSHGLTLVFRDFRGNVPQNTASIFYRHIKNEKQQELVPIFNLEGTHFIYIQKGGLYFVCTTQQNVHPTFTLGLLNRIADLAKDYCGSLNEESIRNNFALISEVLDEVIDYGYPMITKTQAIKPFIFNKAQQLPNERLNFDGIVTNATVFGIPIENLFGTQKTCTSGNSKKSVLVNNMQAVMNQGSSELKNKDIFIDIVEKLTILLSANNQVITAQIDGRVQVKSFLSSDSQIRINLNEGLQIKNKADTGVVNYRDSSSKPIIFDSINFHDCIQEADFEERRMLVFTPQEGETQVMMYRKSGDDIALPFIMHSFLDELNGKEKILSIKIECKAPANTQALDVILKIPFPNSTEAVSHESNSPYQHFEYSQTDKVVFWKIKRVHGLSKFHTRMTFSVSANNRLVIKEIGPISLEFELASYACSGLEICGLKVYESSSTYTPARWVRSITHSDSYVKRI